MTTHTFTIALTDRDTDISDYHSGSGQDTTYVTLTNSGHLEQVNLAHFGIGEPTESGQGPGGDDDVYIDLSGFDDDFDISVQSLESGDTIFISGAIIEGPDAYTVDGSKYTIHFIGADGEPHSLVIDVKSSNTDGHADIVITCFAKGTVIETYHGPCAVEDLDTGDFVLCGDGKHRLVQWIASRHISADELRIHPEFRPIRFRVGSLGHNLPAQDLVVSPQHRMLVSNWRANLMFAKEDVLVPAMFMVNDRTITPDYMASDVTYYHFMFDCHQTVMSNGVPSESFHPGDLALTGINNAARQELFALFPSLKTNPESFGPTCHVAVKSFEAAAMFAAE